MDYKKTVQLPQTEFPMRARLSEREPQRLKVWAKEDPYRTLQEIGRAQGRDSFVLHDGPPYANGHIHIGHALNKVLKDMVVRSKSMEGYRSPYVPGWDTHGLPIELQVVKEEGEELRHEGGMYAFRQACRQYALRYVDVQRDEFRRLGIWGDWERPYLTLEHEYEARQIELFGAMAEKGYIYKGLKPVHWCSSCETALAEAEIEYHDHRSPSVYVAFRVKDAKGLFEDEADFIIWTTTPWTLPANLAIAVHPDLDYVLIEAAGRRYVLAEGLALATAAKLELGTVNVIARFKGRELEGVTTRHPFIDRLSPVILGEHVTLEQGTGCVHTAPGHGLEDYEVGVRYGLDILTPVDGKGRMTEEAGKYVGLSLGEANKAIVADMKADGSLLMLEEVEHQYPYCWRCKNPVAFRATEQWFASVEGFRNDALAAIDEVTWIPSWGIERIRNMVADRSDWCISRQRAWGVPIPIFYCSACREPLISPQSIGAVATLFRNEGSDAWYTTSPESILPEGTACASCGHTQFEKEQDIMDVWFDSGSSHVAVLEERDDLTWPADMYLEGSDQHRGWFQSSLLTAVATRKAPPYRSVLTHGFIVDGDGRKMSKSEGNTTAPEDVMKTYGADILRLWASSADYRGDIRVSDEILAQIAEVYRRIRNTCRFLLGNLHDFDVTRDQVAWDEMREIDRWAVLNVRRLASRAIKGYQEYAFHTVHHLVHNFCAVEMGGFYLDVIKDRLYCDGAASHSRRSAQTAMAEVLTHLVKLIAPILVFTSEEVWEHMPDALKEAKSVHFTMWQQSDALTAEDEALLGTWERLLTARRSVAQALEGARREKVIGGSTEASVTLHADPVWHALLKEYETGLPDVFIVSEVHIEASTGANDAGEEVATGLRVSVGRAQGDRCDRCWRHAPGVGDHTDHPALCTRCRDVVTQVKDA